MADDDHVVQCEKCSRWWHYDCASFNPDLFSTADPWFCEKADCKEESVLRKEKLSATSQKSQEEEVNASFDLVIEAAAVAQAAVAQKDVELNAVRLELKETKDKLSKMFENHFPSTSSGVISKGKSFAVGSNQRLEMIRKIQENHQSLLGTVNHQSQSTPIRKEDSGQGFTSTFHQADMESLLISLNRGNIQELPSFSGENKREWPYFEEVFKSTTMEGRFTGKENVARLRKALKGEAYQLVSDRLKYSSDDSAIMNSLRTVFGRSDVLVHALTADLLRLPVLKSRCDPNLQLWAVKVNGFVADLKSMSCDQDLYNGYVLTDLACKLGAGLYQDWRRKQNSIERVSLKDFADFLSESVIDLPPELLKPSETFSQRSHGSQRSLQRVHTHQPISVSESLAVCIKCNRKQHPLYQCFEFKGLSPAERLQFARDTKLCFSCLDPSKHDWRACSRKNTCKTNGCSGRHHPLLHQSVIKEDLNANAAAYIPQPKFNSSHVHQKAPVLFKVVPIRIHGSDKKFVDTYAFLDDGSSLTMVEKDLFDELGLEGIPEKLTLQWTKGVSRQEDSVRTCLTISSSKKQHRHLLKNVYTVKGLELPTQSVDVAKLKSFYPHLRGLPLLDQVNAKPKILIGLDQAKYLLGTKERHGSDEDPCAIKTLLGWIVYGRASPSFSVSSAYQAHKATMSFMFHDAIKGEEDLHELVKRHFTTEEFGVKPPKGDFVSKEDRRATDIMEQTLKLVDSRYEIGLLWVSDDVKLPDSYSMALKRLVGLEKSLHKKPDMLQWTNSQMAGLLSKGYARVASEEELEQPWKRVWYTPIFMVQSRNKWPPKPRLVADVAAKVNGVSLNTYLLKGPDNLVPLHAGLFKFRERKVAVNADVKEMFHQIRVIEADQQCQRILWRDGDCSREPSVYIMEVMMFGPRSSPSCSQFVKNHHANLFRDEFPEAVDGLTKRTYVDDYFNSHDTVKAAVDVTKAAIGICKSMSFELVGVQSNCHEMLSQIPTSHANPRLVSVNPNECDGVTSKILGMYWHPTRDKLFYKLSVDDVFDQLTYADATISKRKILRAIMRIFDPLGLISHFVIRGRILLQEIWREGYDWDEALSNELKTQWATFSRELKNIERIEIPRWYLWTSSIPKVSLVIFTDASEKAFAAVAFFSFQKEEGAQCCLVMAKAKVVPVKKLSVPRLELQAAVLGVRLATTIKQSHTLPIHTTIFLSDSRTVLSWIGSTKYKFPSFVASRVGEILDSSTARQWYYIKSADNVADDATRWSDAYMGDSNSRWFQGPAFLKGQREDWPITSHKVSEPEVMPEDNDLFLLFHYNQDISYSVYDDLSARFKARWSSSVRAIAFFLRLKDVCRKRPSDKEAFITPNEFNRAEDWLFRKIQQDAFPNEIKSLTAKNVVDTSSSILSLSPFRDKEGTIRLGSRAQRALASYASRNPAILPKNHPLVDVFVQHYHEQNLHLGTSLVISDIRERAWIISIRAVVQKIKSRCCMCKISRAKPVMPLMGQLPTARVSFDQRPFTHVGVDCFGPLLVKFGRGTVKRYGMIFTCLTFRAVQIELLNDLSLDQCSMALRRFVINRVVTRFLYSDNGLNFVGTKNILERDIREMEATLSEHAAKYEGIRWYFIPAYSPWMGGAWERLIQSIKIAVEFILRGIIPREDVLRNALLEAQGQINRRPLTHFPVDPEDPKPLTPNSILFGEDDKDVTAPGVFSDNDAFSKLYCRRSQHLMAEFTKRWYREYLPEILRRSKWHQVSKPVEVGKLVILVEPNEIRAAWRLGRIDKVYPGPDGVIRTADVRLHDGALKTRRSVGRLAVLDVESSPVQTAPGVSSSQN